MSYPTVAALALLALVALLLGSRRGRAQARARRLRLASPTLGILNLQDRTALPLVTADRTAVSPFFATVVESTAMPPSCDVLLVYCDIDAEGTIAGSTFGLREIIREAGAKVAIVASENPGAHCVKAVKPTGYGKANLVLTLNRKGEAFAKFYRRLFEQMSNGISMPIAWVKLAPQVPGGVHPDCPDGVFMCELGQVAFEPADDWR